jgi:hypothetical protein
VKFYRPMLICMDDMATWPHYVTPNDKFGSEQ